MAAVPPRDSRYHGVRIELDRSDLVFHDVPNRTCRGAGIVSSREVTGCGNRGNIRLPVTAESEFTDLGHSLAVLGGAALHQIEALDQRAKPVRKAIREFQFKDNFFAEGVFG